MIIARMRSAILTLFSALFWLILTVVITLLLVSCGGGGGGSSSSLADGGIEGTGISHGSITGFGSIFVNGSRLDISGASITVDGTAASENDLKLGMVVTALVNLSSNAVITVEADDDLEGPIADVPVLDPDGFAKTFTLLGTTVIVHKDETVFDNNFPGFVFDTIKKDDIVEVYGFFDENDNFIVRHIEKQGDFTPGTVVSVEVKGTIAGLVVDSVTNTFTFEIRGLTVTGDGTTDLSDVPGGLADDLFVEVKGMLQLDGTVHANSIELEGFDDSVDKMSVEGIIEGFTDLTSDFVVNTGEGPVTVNASGATLDPANLVLANGLEVEVEGRISNGILQALTVEARGGDVKVHATVITVDPTGPHDGTVTLEVAPGQTVMVKVNNQTRMEDDRDGVSPYTLTFLGSGDFAEIRAFENGNGDVIATRLERDNPDDVILQGFVQAASGSNNDGTVTVLGVMFSTFAGITQFEDVNDNPLVGDFFDHMPNGHLVKIKDKDDTASTPDDGLGDGTADEVDFED